MHGLRRRKSTGARPGEHQDRRFWSLSCYGLTNTSCENALVLCTYKPGGGM